MVLKNICFLFDTLKIIVRHQKDMLRFSLIIFLQGIYRISGVKSRVEKVCQSFEMDSVADAVIDLEDENPRVVSNVLKLYLRQVII